MIVQVQPALNPDAGIWTYLKRVELGNLWCPDLAALALALRRRHVFSRRAIMISARCKRQ
jgi:hypothetical protein